VDFELGKQASAADDASVEENGTGDTFVYCAFNAGPVLSCDVPASAGPVQRCAATARYCVDVGGQWGCCSGRTINDGAHGVCFFSSTPGYCR
jgi:hypothetical protein